MFSWFTVKLNNYLQNKFTDL